MISIEKAQELLLASLPARNAEDVGFIDAQGRILAEDISAPSDFPPFHRSAMDGYAVRSEDAKSVPAELALIGESRAGCRFVSHVLPGQAVSIMTGAPIPDGADAVQTLEQTRPSEDGRSVTLLAPVRPGDNVTPSGHEASRGDCVLEKGRILGPVEIAVLASIGCLRVRVFRSPRVALMSSGDELVEPHQDPQADQIRNSNASSLRCQLRQMGIFPSYLGIVGDDEMALQSGILSGLESDVLIITGGVSVGTYDKVKTVFHQLGLEILFSKVAMRPGKPTVFARRDDKLIFGLPGNPISTFVAFEIFVRPALGRLCGFNKPELPRIRGTLSKEIKQNPGRTSFLPAQVSLESGKWRIDPLPWRGSADIFTFSRSNAMLIFPGDCSRMAQGEGAEALLLPDFFGRQGSGGGR